jgi:hypothetical protein
LRIATWSSPVQHRQPLGGALVAGVEDEPVGVDDRGRADVLLVGPVHRAGGGAGGAQDAPGGVVEALAVDLVQVVTAGIAARELHVDQPRKHRGTVDRQQVGL